MGYLLYNRRNKLYGKMFNQKRHFLFCQAGEKDVTFYTASSSPILLPRKTPMGPVAVVKGEVD